MEKHKDIPSAAVWNAEWKGWMLGAQNERGEKIGIWEAWHIDGHHCGTTDYGDGTPPFLNQRFHPDGTLAQQGYWLGENKWTGCYRWIKSEHATPEYFPGGYTTGNALIWTIEYDYTAEGTAYNARRYFDRQHHPVTEKGTPLPERPSTVPDRACFVDADSAKQLLPHWVMSEFDPWKNRYIGEYAEWDTSGNLLLKRHYNRDTGMPEEAFMAAIVPEKISYDHYQHTDPPVLRQSRHSAYNGNDYRQLFFDEEGKLLYFVRRQYIPSFLTRKYYNDILIYEIVRVPHDAKQAPTSVKYFYPDGAILIDYHSNGDGTGNWSMYDEAGTALLVMRLEKEAFVNERHRWDYFIPRSTSAPEHTTIASYQDAIIRNFRKEYEQYMTGNSIKSLSVPDYLQKELDNIDWERIETSNGQGEELPAEINAVLSGDDAIAAAAAKWIWWKIAYQGDVFEATYTTATILARMIPYCTHTPVVEERLFGFLYEIMIQPNIRRDGYVEMISSMEFLIPQLLQRAGAKEPITASQAQCILIHVGKYQPETVKFLQREWQDTDYTRERRAHALFCLGRLYELRDETEKMEADLKPAFEVEKDALLQLILAIMLVRNADNNAPDNWVMCIINALVHDSAIIAELTHMRPFIGENGVLQYLMDILYNTNGIALAKHIRSLIMALPSCELSHQHALMEVICSTLFSPGYVEMKVVLPEIGNALRALKELGEQAPEFIKAHSDVLTSYEVDLDQAYS